MQTDFEDVDPKKYVEYKEEYEERRDEFMKKYLVREWPKKIICGLGLLQLAINLAILGVDLPIILMFAPRWEVFAGCWTFGFGMIACISTLHSIRKITWLKLKWAVAFNILAALAAGVMTSFDILYSINPYICVITSGCNYLSYTYTVANSFYAGQAFLGILFILTVFIFLVFFIKYGIGGRALFDDIQTGLTSINDSPKGSSFSTTPILRHSTAGPGVMNIPPSGPMRMPGARPPTMLHSPYGPTFSGPRPPMMMHSPYGPRPGLQPPMMMRHPINPMAAQNYAS